MARRPQPEERDRPLTREQLSEYKRKLEEMPHHHVSTEYQKAYEQCKLENDRTPMASAVQQLVAAWKLIWKRKRNRRYMGRG